MNTHKAWVQWSVLACAIVATALVTWRIARQDLARCEVDDTLLPIAALLADNGRIIDSLKHDGLADSESAILDSYLQRIRKDGLPKNSAMKQRIDALVNNDTAIVTLLSKYAPHATTSDFRARADQYRDYASRFRDRWQSTFEIFMAGGNLPAAGPQRPTSLQAALNAEIAQVR